MCTWTSAGSVWRGTTCVLNHSRDREPHTPSAVVWMVWPGVDSAPSVPGKTQVRSRKMHPHVEMSPFVYTWNVPSLLILPPLVAFRWLCCNVQPATEGGFRQSARKAGVWIWARGARRWGRAFCPSILGQLWKPWKCSSVQWQWLQHSTATSPGSYPSTPRAPSTTSRLCRWVFLAGTAAIKAKLFWTFTINIVLI